MAHIPLQNEDILRKGYDPYVTRRLIAFVHPYLSSFLVAILLMLINSGAAVAGPYLVKIALDNGIQANNPIALRNAVLLYLLAAGIQWISIYFRVNLMARVGQSIIYDLRSRLFSHLQKLSLSFYNRYSVGKVITRIINDVGVLREFLTWAILAIARDLFSVFGIIIAMVSMNANLSLWTFSVLPLMVISTIIFRKRARENYRLVRAAISWVNSVLAENINAVRVVQAFSRQEVNYKYYSQTVNRNNLDKNLKAVRVAAAFPATVDFLGSLAAALVILIGGAAVLGEQISAGVLVAFVLYIDRFFDPIRDLSQRYDSFQSTMAGGERIFALLDTPAEITDSPDAIELPEIRGEVTFENLCFHYDDDELGEKGQPVIRHVNLHVDAGETIALVGETGSGKTTLVKLLCRFHDPLQGRILIDGYDIRHVTQHSLRQQLGLVLQDPFLFNGTVSENIRFGRLNAKDQDIEAAAKAVGAHDFISQLQKGYHTQVEEGGALLSVGQRQLISFARALLADPRILILDEATSSVDTQTERIIQQALARLLTGRTAFVIAHRLSTVTNADRIVVIHKGKIVEEGKHLELLALRGHYFRLYSLGLEE
ncbi:MAG: ABC transporter ATP-binding protein [Anaerolineales bacterium]